MLFIMLSANFIVSTQIPRFARDCRQMLPDVLLTAAYSVALFTTAANARLRSYSLLMELAVLM